MYNVQFLYFSNSRQHSFMISAQHIFSGWQEHTVLFLNSINTFLPISSGLQVLLPTENFCLLFATSYSLEIVPLTVSFAGSKTWLLFHMLLLTKICLLLFQFQLTRNVSGYFSSLLNILQKAGVMRIFPCFRCVFLYLQFFPTEDTGMSLTFFYGVVTYLFAFILFL